MSAAVIEAVNLISKQPCPGISTETDIEAANPLRQPAARITEIAVYNTWSAGTFS